MPSALNIIDISLWNYRLKDRLKNKGDRDQC